MSRPSMLTPAEKFADQTITDSFSADVLYPCTTIEKGKILQQLDFLTLTTVDFLTQITAD